MTGRQLKPLLLRAAVFSALVLLVAVSAVVIVRRNAATPVDTRQILSITRDDQPLPSQGRQSGREGVCAASRRGG